MHEAVGLVPKRVILRCGLELFGKGFKGVRYALVIELRCRALDRIELRLDRERANNRAEDLKSIEIDNAAGSITVGALNPADVTELIRLAGDLDESIVRSKLLNLTLQAVGQVLDSVVRVKDILKS